MIVLMRHGRVIVAALSLLFAVALPQRAEARVTVTVEFAYGTAVVGGIGLFIYIGGSGEYHFGERDIPTALLEFRGSRHRWGVPLALPRLAPGADPLAPEADGVQADLVRFRF